MSESDGECLAEARARHYRDNGFSPDPWAEDWVRVELGPIPFVFPNTEGRKRAVGFHDLHHVLTGYATDLRGEAEISAWELASPGIYRFPAGAMLDLGGVALGLLIAPRRTWKAFVRGRRCTNLYETGVTKRDLDGRVDAVRRRVGLLHEPQATKGDVVAFCALATASLLYAVSGPLAVAALVVGLYLPPSRRAPPALQPA